MATKNKEQITRPTRAIDENESFRRFCEGNHFKELRRERGLTVEYVAKKIGVSMSKYSLFERGLQDLRPDALRKLEVDILKLSEEERQITAEARMTHSEARELVGLAKYLPWLKKLNILQSNPNAAFWGPDSTAGKEELEQWQRAAHVAKIAAEAQKGEALGIDPLLSTIIIYERQLEAARVNTRQLIKAYETQERFFKEMSRVLTEKNQTLTAELKECKDAGQRLVKQVNEARFFGEPE